MRKISAGRGKTFGLKHGPRRIARDNAAPDNEEEVIGTQLRFGMGDCQCAGLAESEER
jgi:hypothetical protein